MKTNERLLGVALVKEACPICTKEIDGPILLNKVLSPKRAKEVEELHGKTIGWAKEPCPECKEMMAKAILLIEYDEEKTEDKNNPYRTGRIFGVTEDFIRRTVTDFQLKERILQKRVTWFPLEVAKSMGFHDLETK